MDCFGHHIGRKTIVFFWKEVATRYWLSSKPGGTFQGGARWCRVCPPTHGVRQGREQSSRTLCPGNKVNSLCAVCVTNLRQNAESLSSY